MTDFLPFLRFCDIKADGFIKFILNRMLLKHEDISVMYGINGEENLEEKTLDYLEGYKKGAELT